MNYNGVIIEESLEHKDILKDVKISETKIEEDKKIVEKIEAERALVESAKKLIEVYEQKTKEVVAKLCSTGIN